MFNKIKFQNKLFILLSILLSILLFISGTIFYLYTTSIIKQNIANTQKQTTQKLQEQIDSMLNEMNQTSIQINASEYIMDVLHNINDSPDENYFDKYPVINNSVRKTIFSYLSLKPLKGRISIISKYYDYTDLNNRLDSQIVTKEYIRGIQRINEIMKSKKYMIYLSPHKDDWSANNEIVFSVVRPLRDISNEVYGIVEVSRIISELDNLCTFNEGTNCNVLIFNENKELIYNNFNDSISFDKDLITNEISKEPFGSFAINSKNNKQYIASFSKLSTADWSVVLLQDVYSSQKSVNYLKTVIIATYLIAFFALLFVLYIFTRSITKPIKNLKQAVLSMDIDNLKLNHVSTNNEITLLSDALQHMLDEIKRSNEIIIESNSREAKAHLLALQAQLNPHFLYNTLSVIGAYGQAKGNIEVMEMCADLSNMLRYTITLDNKDSTIAMEIKYIESYLKLMNKRFDGFFKYEIEIDEVLFKIKIPKLSLQPLVENCFKHAFKDINPPWIIKIKGFIKDRDWHIRVIDNGNGFDQATINRIKVKLSCNKNKPITDMYSNDSEAQGLGLINTFMRLHLFFNNNEIIDIFNLDENGSVVEIGGPIQ
jgi:two-component system, sensor histidine kinase YesM